MKKELKEILQDNTSGSSEILLKITEILLHSDNEDAALEIISILKTELSSFQAVVNFLNSIADKILKGGLDEAKSFAKEFQERQKEIYVRIYKNFRPLLKDLKSIFTLSNSLTVSEVFKLALKDFPQLKFIIAESRPAFEGRILAQKLTAENASVELITDSMAADAIEGAGAAAAGADKILIDRSAVNKTGSLAAAIICQYFNKPFYVIAAKSKFSREDKYQREYKPPEEVWEYNHNNLSVKNFYFEVVEKELITKIITEE